MKTLTTLTAVAALIAGISIASAQMGSSPSTSQSGTQKVTGNSAFCINSTSASAGLNCKYQTMAACEKDAKAQNVDCSPNPNKSTTGSKQ